MPYQACHRLESYISPTEKALAAFHENVKVGLYFDCDWNEEDGFGIKFVGNGNIVRIGTGDVIY